MEKRRNETALIYGETTLTYGQLDKASQQLAKRFEEKGAVGSIGGFTTTPVSFVISMLASWRCGKVFVPLCLTHSNLELNYFIDDSNVRTVAVFSKNDLNEDFIDTLIEKKIAIEETTKDDDTIVGDTFTVGDTLTDTGGALVVYTSGTTGRPKGVLHTHSSLNSMIKSLVTSWEYSNEDKILHFLPLYHVHGLVNKLLCMLWVGGQVEFLHSVKPNPLAVSIWHRLAHDQVLYEKYQVQVQSNQENNIEKETVSISTPDIFRGISLFMAVPTVYARMLESVSTIPAPTRTQALQAISRMRLNVSGSAAMPDPTHDRWEALTGQVLLERYGMTEIGMALTNPYRDIKGRLRGHVGFPFPQVQCQLVAGGEEEGSEGEEEVVVTPGIPGELRIKGPLLFKEYLNNVSATKKAFDNNGWFKTGDVATLEANGYYRILGRISSDIIKSGGFKLSALEIEREILAHEDIKEVAVIGVPEAGDGAMGELVVAVIVLKSRGGGGAKSEKPYCGMPGRLEQALYDEVEEQRVAMTTASLSSFLTDRLARYKHPKRLVILDSLPRNPMGKVNKKALKASIGVILKYS